MTEEARSFDSIENHPPGVDAEETDGEHVTVPDAESYSRQCVCDIPLDEEPVSVRLDDDRAAVRAPVGARPLALVDSRESRFVGARCVCRVAHQWTYPHREHESQEHSG
jgi:hypothetical protein